MKPRLFRTLSLFAVLLASACAPAATESAVQPSVTVPVEASPTLLVDIFSPTLDAISTEALPPTAVPVVTSRGPDLHATDPTTVNLASGGLQFVEFFRFT
jgi:hypothetical protein